MFRIMINPLLSYDHLRRNSKQRAGIQVAVKLWKGARGGLQADTMALFEHLRSVPAVDVYASANSATTILGVQVGFLPLDCIKFAPGTVQAFF